MTRVLQNMAQMWGSCGMDLSSPSESQTCRLASDFKACSVFGKHKLGSSIIDKIGKNCIYYKFLPVANTLWFRLDCGDSETKYIFFFKFSEWQWW